MVFPLPTCIGGRIFRFPIINQILINTNSNLGVGKTTHVHIFYIKMCIFSLFDGTVERAYDGSTITLPPTGLTVKKPIGDSSTKGSSTLPVFGSFVVEER